MRLRISQDTGQLKIGHFKCVDSGHALKGKEKPWKVMNSCYRWLRLVLHLHRDVLHVIVTALLVIYEKRAFCMFVVLGRQHLRSCS